MTQNVRLINQSFSINNLRQNSQSSMANYGAVQQNPPNPDPANKPESQKGISWIMATLLLVNYILGGCILPVPLSFLTIGSVFYSILVIFLVGVLITASLIPFGYFASIKDECESFEEASMKAFGNKKKQGAIFVYIVSITLLIYLFGYCISQFVVIGDELDLIFGFFCGSSFPNYWYLQRPITLPIASIIFILPLTFAKKVDFLLYPSMIAVVGIFYVVGLVIYKFFTLTNILNGGYIPIQNSAGENILNNGSTFSVSPTTFTSIGSTKPNPKGDLIGAFNFFNAFDSVSIYCQIYQCHTAALPILITLKKKTYINRKGEIVRRVSLIDWSLTACTSLFICFVLYSACGAFGYLTFGNSVQGDILLNYDSNSVAVLIGIGFIAWQMCTSYPQNSIVARDTLMMYWNQLRKCCKSKKNLSTNHIGVNSSEPAEQMQNFPENNADSTPINIPPQRWFNFLYSSELIQRIIFSTLWFGSTLFLSVSTDSLALIIQLVGSFASLFIFFFPGIILLLRALELKREIEPGSRRIYPPQGVNKRKLIFILIASFFILLGAFLFGDMFTESILSFYQSDTGNSTTNSGIQQSIQLQRHGT